MLKCVLVIEDSAVMRELCVDVLLQAGFAVDTVHDTTAAMPAVANTDYCFIMLGSATPVAVSLIRAVQEACGKYSPLIAVSGSAAQCDDRIQMPVSSESLRSTLDRWFHYSRGRARVSDAA